MIFFAVAAPTPGSAVSSFSPAVLRSTRAAGAAAAPLFAAGAAGAAAAAAAAAADGSAHKHASRAIAAARPAARGQDLLRDAVIAFSFSRNWRDGQKIRCDRRIVERSLPHPATARGG